MTCIKTPLNRADLLRLLLTEGEQVLHKSACFLGFRYHQPALAINTAPETFTVVNSEPEPLLIPTQAKPQGVFFRVSEHYRETEATEKTPEQPEWFINAQAFEQDDTPDPQSLHLPKYELLTRWSRLWPLLKKQLGQKRPSRKPDVQNLVKRIALGNIPGHLPVLARHGWSDRLCIVLDYARQTQPFHDDYNQLVRKLGKLHGTLNLELRLISDTNNSPFSYRKPGDVHTVDWQMPVAGTPVLILSDLGLLAEDSEHYSAWQGFGRQLNLAGIKALVLAPVSCDLDNSGFKRLFSLYGWDTKIGMPCQQQQQTDSQAVEKLLVLLSLALIIEPRLLRATRKLLSQTLVTVSAEAQFWQHAHIDSCSHSASFKTPEIQKNYQHQLNADFLHAIGISAEQLFITVRRHHCYLPLSIQMMELHNFINLLPECVSDNERQAFENWQHAMVKTCYQHRYNDTLTAWNNRYVKQQTQDNSLPMQALSVLQQRHLAEIVLENADDWQQLEFLLPKVDASTLECTLYQRGEFLIIATGDKAVKGSVLTTLILPENGWLQLETEHNNSLKKTKIWHWALEPAFLQQEKILTKLDRTLSRTRLITSHDSLVLEAIKKPDWAHAVSRDSKGLWLEFSQHHQRWQILLPDWCNAIAYDNYGLYADFSINAISQRCRWLPPGTFLMGSPPGEIDRSESETQHQVTLSEGFWLADTTCTQGLWQAVMGENPAYFKEDINNPVENVSWDDVQEFLQKLNSQIPGLQSGLPTEAQWEYACRAGTPTVFSFGDNISPEQVNYDGGYPYANGKKGLNRGKTVAVKSLPANPWGLYEMHGNVWEWCQDYYGNYTDATRVDPLGADSGSIRVLRGGCWSNYGRYTRSAQRSRSAPGSRYRSVGFRFAPGQASGRSERAATPETAERAR